MIDELGCVTTKGKRQVWVVLFSLHYNATVCFFSANILRLGLVYI